MAGTLCLTGCGSNSSSESSTGSSKSEKQVTVAVVQPMSHTSLDQIRDTITSELGKDDNIKGHVLKRGGIYAEPQGTHAASPGPLRTFRYGSSASGRLAPVQ